MKRWMMSLAVVVVVGAAGRAHAWDAESPDDERNSTHLFIVNRALGILEKHATLPVAARAVALLEAPSCRARWQSGLIDADYKAAYSNGRSDVPYGATTAQLVESGATWHSHFWDPDTGRNYLGTRDVANGAALTHLENAKSLFARRDLDGGCYEVGLSLHYMTDITQPMHASNFSATSWPMTLHPHMEGRAMAIQGRFSLGEWNGEPKATTNEVLDTAAHTAKAMWPATWDAVGRAYAARGCAALSEYYVDHTDCWVGDGAIDAELGAALLAAQDAAAQFIYAADLE